MTTRSHPAITASGLRKSFGDHVVLDGVDLEVPAGTVFALLGPNGAGKTTTVLLGPAIGNSAVIALAWCVAIALVGYLWARRLYNRDPIR